jgi:hypothetical protein
MKLRTVGVSVTLVVVVCAIYGFLIWSGLQADRLREQELNITSLQDNVAELSKVQRIVQEGLSQDVQDLEFDVDSVSTHNRELILELSDKVDTIYEVLSARLSSQVEKEFEEVMAIHEEIEDLSGLVNELREELEAVPVISPGPTPIEEFTGERVVSTFPIPSPPPPPFIEPIEVDIPCPKSPDNADIAQRILTRAMERTSRTGTYAFTATFGVASDGTTYDIIVVGNGPKDLHRAVERYARALNWTLIDEVNGCELKLKLYVK